MSDINYLRKDALLIRETRLLKARARSLAPINIIPALEASFGTSLGGKEEKSMKQQLRKSTAAQQANCFLNQCSCVCDCATHCAVETSSWYPEEAHSRPYVTTTNIQTTKIHDRNNW